MGPASSFKIRCSDPPRFPKDILVRPPQKGAGGNALFLGDRLSREAVLPANGGNGFAGNVAQPVQQDGYSVTLGTRQVFVPAPDLFDLSRVLDVPVSYFFDDMDEDLKTQSPAQIAGVGELVDLPASCGEDPLTKRETLELVRAYYRIRDPEVRKRVYELAKVLGAQALDEAE